MISFALCPLQAGCVPTPSSHVLEQALLGGFARQRVGFVNNVWTVNASVSLHKKVLQQYFWAFWREHTFAPKPFLWRLMLDDTEMTTYQCQFIANSVSVGERNGRAYQVSFQIRVKPKPRDAEFDQAILDVWETGSPKDVVNLLEPLVNHDLPDALENL